MNRPLLPPALLFAAGILANEFLHLPPRLGFAASLLAVVLATLPSRAQPGSLWVGWALGDVVATTLFGIVAFFALREFVTLSPTGRGDHRGLVLAFFVVLPVQYWLVGSGYFDLFAVFIPVYVFLVY